MKKYNGWQDVKTLQTKEILDELIEAKDHQAAKLIISDTGLGKTHTLKLFRHAKPDHTYVIVVGDSFKLADVLDELLMQMGLYKSAKRWAQEATIRYKLSQIKMALRSMRIQNKKPIIIIDEAENLKPNALRMMKELYDAIIEYCSLVLIGTPQILDTIFNRRRRNRTGVPQLWRRFKAGTREVTPLDKVRDFTPFFDMYIPDEEDVQDLLIELCENFGELHDYLDPVLRHCANNNKPLTKQTFLLFHKLKYNNISKLKKIA
jgi:DNA transposition AAA+ family ATPase